MPYIITYAHQKGGVGKTTTLLNVCDNLTQRLQTAVVDADPQGSIVRLLETFGAQKGRSKLKIINQNQFNNFQTLKEEYNEFDVLFIDTPPYLSDKLPEIFDISDLVIIPTKCSPLDALAIESTLELISESQERNPELKAAILLTMTIPRSNLTKKMRTLFNEKNFPVLQTEIVNRVVYSQSLLLSNSVFGSDNKKAKEEINNLSLEIINFLKS